MPRKSVVTTDQPCTSSPLTSIKIGVVLLATLLLVTRFIGETTWGTVVTALLAMRELSEFRQNYFNGNASES